jgi:hypothetical protein
MVVEDISYQYYAKVATEPKSAVDHDGGKKQLQSKHEGRVYFWLPSSRCMSIISDHSHQHDFMFMTLESVLLNPKLVNDPTRRS